MNPLESLKPHDRQFNTYLPSCFFFYLFANHFRTFYWPHSLVCLFRPECFFFGWCHQVWMKALIGKLGKINVSLGLRRLHYSSCLIKQVLLLKFVFKYINYSKFSPHLNFVKVHVQMSWLPLIKTYLWSRALVAITTVGAALPDPCQ